jgi:hypothetical protein
MPASFSASSAGLGLTHNQFRMIRSGLLVATLMSMIGSPSSWPRLKRVSLEKLCAAQAGQLFRPQSKSAAVW